MSAAIETLSGPVRSPAPSRPSPRAEPRPDAAAFTIEDAGQPPQRGGPSRARENAERPTTNETRPAEERAAARAAPATEKDARAEGPATPLDENGTSGTSATGSSAKAAADAADQAAVAPPAQDATEPTATDTASTTDPAAAFAALIALQEGAVPTAGEDVAGDAEDARTEGDADRADAIAADGDPADGQPLDGSGTGQAPADPAAAGAAGDAAPSLPAVAAAVNPAGQEPAGTATEDTAATRDAGPAPASSATGGATGGKPVQTTTDAGAGVAGAAAPADQPSADDDGEPAAIDSEAQAAATAADETDGSRPSKATGAPGNLTELAARLGAVLPDQAAAPEAVSAAAARERPAVPAGDNPAGQANGQDDAEGAKAGGTAGLMARLFGEASTDSKANAAPAHAATGAEVSGPPAAVERPNVSLPTPATVPEPARATPALPVVQAPLAAVPIEVALKAMAGVTRFEIRLDPAELGRVDVRLEIEGGEVRAHVSVDRVETLALLQRDARTLERAFEQAGLKTADQGIDLSLRNQNTGQDQRNGEAQPDGRETGRRASAADDEANGRGRTPTADMPITRTWRSHGGVDLRI